jgi:hypothetical protein
MSDTQPPPIAVPTVVVSPSLKPTTTTSLVHTPPVGGSVMDSTTVTTTQPGWRTSEFWGALAASILGALMTSGLWADGSVAMRIAGVALVALASLGYSTSRGLSKGGAS